MALRAAELSSSAGFELLMCTYMSLPTPSCEKAAIDPLLARHRDMAHAGAGLVEQALLDHLVVGEERAIEKDERRALQAAA